MDHVECDRQSSAGTLPARVIPQRSDASPHLTFSFVSQRRQNHRRHHCLPPQVPVFYDGYFYPKGTDMVFVNMPKDIILRAVRVHGAGVRACMLEARQRHAPRSIVPAR